MPKTRWEVRTHALALCACFGLPLLSRASVEFWPLGAVLLLAVAAWGTIVRSSDPFLSTGLVNVLACLIYGNAFAYSLSATPALPTPSVLAVLAAVLYVAVASSVIARAGRRVAEIDLEYFRYSLPSKRLRVDMGRRTGRLDQTQAALRLQLFVKEGLQFRRLSRVCRLLMLQVWGGLVLFVLFGAHQSGHLLIYLASSLVLSAGVGSIASRATLHPGMPLELGIGDNQDDDDSWDQDDEVEEYRPRRYSRSG